MTVDQTRALQRFYHFRTMLTDVRLQLFMIDGALYLSRNQQEDGNWYRVQSYWANSQPYEILTSYVFQVNMKAYRSDRPHASKGLEDLWLRIWLWWILEACIKSEMTYEGKVKCCNLAYNRHETREKRLLGRDQDRSWCHLHTSVKLFVAAHGSMGIGGSIRVCCSQSMDP